MVSFITSTANVDILGYMRQTVVCGMSVSRSMMRNDQKLCLTCSPAGSVGQLGDWHVEQNNRCQQHFIAKNKL